MRHVLWVVGCALTAAALSAGPAAAAEVEWKFFSYFPPNDTPPKVDREFAEDLLKASNGRFKMTVYTAGELPYKGPDTLKIVANNQVQMALSVPGFVAGDVPELNVLSLPFLCTSYDQYDKAVPAMAPIFDRVMKEKFNVKVMMHWTMPSQNIWLNRPISSFDELKGMKVRIWSPIQNDMLKLFDASSVSITTAEVVPALDRKVIDGAITSALSANDWKSYQTIKTGFMINFIMGSQFVLASGEAFAKLPPDLHKLLTDKSAEWAPRYRKASEDGDQAARASLQANGVKLVEPSAADLKQATARMRPLWDEWMQKNGAVGKELVEATSKACAS